MPLRVRWAEVDKQGVVFNAHYLLYADVCATEYWRAIGMRYPEDFEPVGSDLYVRRATVDYRAAAVYDDELEVCGRIARIGSTSLRFSVGMFRRGGEEAPLVAVDLVYVYVDAATKTPRRVDDAVRTKIRAFEAVAPDESSDGPR
ncbi:MAG TPA: thioesterase family protein [Burkholderiaceae bacterium]|nr:thioesterase family protein [Burkholderiaceae bacterium]